MGELEDERAADAAWPDNVNGGLGCCLPPRPDLPLLGGDGDGLVAGGAADTFLASGCSLDLPEQTLSG